MDSNSQPYIYGDDIYGDDIYLIFNQGFNEIIITCICQ